MMDTNKLARLELLPPNAIEEVSRVIELGVKKYGKNDFIKLEDLSHTSMVGKAMRHLTTYLKGHDLDPEIETHHVAHAAACLLILLEMQIVGAGKDDR